VFLRLVVRRLDLSYSVYSFVGNTLLSLATTALVPSLLSTFSLSPRRRINNMTPHSNRWELWLNIARAADSASSPAYVFGCVNDLGCVQPVIQQRQFALTFGYQA
jgi:hypothetical protein